MVTLNTNPQGNIIGLDLSAKTGVTSMVIMSDQFTFYTMAEWLNHIRSEDEAQSWWKRIAG